MRHSWLLLCLIACCMVMVIFFLSAAFPVTAIYLVRDAFDPIDSLIEPYAEDLIEYRNPYFLGHLLPSLNGMAFVFGSQAKPFAANRQTDYVPIYSARIVIAVNQHSHITSHINGWQSLLDNEATVLIPDSGTESGRLAAIALAIGLGAAEGDLAPALAAYRRLEEEGRLNPKNEHASTEYRHMYQPHRLPAYDAVILWDYQSHVLERMTGHWEMVIPVEGTVTIDCGYIHSHSFRSDTRFDEIRSYLDSEEAKEDFLAAGFSPLSFELTDLSGWDQARLVYNPDFRRTVRQEKLYAPASVRERLLLKSITFILFLIAAQAVIRRIPQRLNRTVSVYALLLVMIWMLTGIMKTVNYQPLPMRLFWFASYLPRHFLPVTWFWMCHVHVRKRLPGQITRVVMLVLAGLFTAMVMTNDWHHHVFIYHQADPLTWEHQYSNGWGYYLSFVWSFSVFMWGLILLFRQKISRQQKRQYLFAGLLFLALVAYQFSYMLGLEQILDLDIPSTVAIFILLFILSAQQERFMGAVLMALPTFQNTPHALAVHNQQGEVIYQNKVMSNIQNESQFDSKNQPATETTSGNSVFQTHIYPLEKGHAVIMEDITELKDLEQSLAASHKRLHAIQQLLLHRAEEIPAEVSKIEHECYCQQMDRLFMTRLAIVRHELKQMAAHAAEDESSKLKQIRFLIFICQQRLRFLIRSLEVYPDLPAEFIEQYANRLMRQGLSLGLDGILTANIKKDLPAGIASDLLDGIDSICLYSMHIPGSSLICHLENHASGILLRAFITSEYDNVPEPGSIPFQLVTHHKQQANAKFKQAWSLEGLSINIHLAGQEDGQEGYS